MAGMSDAKTVYRNAPTLNSQGTRGNFSIRLRIGTEAWPTQGAAVYKPPLSLPLL
jgi:hypothetical protein